MAKSAWYRAHQQVPLPGHWHKVPVTRAHGRVSRLRQRFGTFELTMGDSWRMVGHDPRRYDDVRRTFGLIPSVYRLLYKGSEAMSTQHFAPARVVIFTADACLTASVETTGERVKDLLNTQSKFIELSNVTYSNPERPSVAITEYANGTVRKSDIGCVIVLSEPPQTNVKKLGTYIQKRPIRVSVLVPGMVVVGLHHTQGRFDPSSLLSDALEQFVPLTEAGVLRARTTTPTSAPPERLTVFINRTHITGVFAHEYTETGSLSVDEHVVRGISGTGSLSGTGTLPPLSGTAPTTGRLRRFSNSESSW